MDKTTKIMLVALIIGCFVLLGIYSFAILNKVNPDYFTQVMIVDYADKDQKRVIDRKYFYRIGPDEREIRWVR